MHVGPDTTVLSTEQSYKSIKQDIFKSSLSLSLLILILFGLFLTQILYQSGIETARSVIKQRNYAVSYFIDGYFSEIKSVVEMLAENESVRHGADLSTPQKQDVVERYRLIAERHRYVSYLYSGYEDKKGLLIYDYTTPEGYDPTVRPWYIAAINSQPNLSTGVPYHDITTHEWLLSTGKVLYTEDNRVSGVIAADSSIDVLMAQLAKRGDIYQSSYSYVINPESKVILHHKQEYLDRNIKEMVTEHINFDAEEGYISYELNNKNKIAYFSHTYEADWIVVTVVEEDEILKGIIFKIGFYVLVVLVAAISLGFSQSSILSRKFSVPLVKLQTKVKSVVQGDWETEASSEYPNNEIGLISQEIDKLTTEELYAKSQELKRLNTLLEEKASTDQLTGLYNRHKIDDDLEALYQRMTRYNQPFSIILLDIDWFKKVNDVYGHQMGDTTLRELAYVLKQNVRSVDSVGRWGGEEFIIVCPEIHLEEAKHLADRICSEVQSYSFSIKQQVTISLGAAECSRAESIDNLIHRADKNLYMAKQKGRNAVV